MKCDLGYRLSPRQRRLWMSDAATRAVVQRCVVADGPLDPSRLRAALVHVVERHEALRTTFVQPPALLMPLQTAAGADITWSEMDLSGEPSDDRGRQLDHVVACEREAPVDLETGSGMRAMLVRCGADRYVLILTAGAVRADLSSLRIAVEEAVRLYGGADPSGDDPLPFVTVANWENEVLEHDDDMAARADAFFRERLGGPIAAATSAAEAPPSGAARINVLSLTFNDRLVHNLRERGEALGVDAEAWLFTVLHALLSRVRPDDSSLLGIASDPRTDAGLGDVCGPLTRCVPARVRSDGTLRFDAAARQSAQEVRESRGWHWYCDDLVWSRACNRENSALPALTQFAYERLRRLPEANAVSFRFDAAFASDEPIRLALRCTEQDDSVRCDWFFDERRYGATEVRALAARYVRLLEDSLDRFSTPLGSLNVLAPAERQALTGTLAKGVVRSVPDVCVHQLIEQQAARVPGHAAVRAGERMLTYEALNAGANAVARRLSCAGVQPDSVVALCLPRSPELIVGLLGILKAGAAYMPIDPALPRDRQRFLMDLVRPSAIVGNCDASWELETPVTPVVLLDDKASTLADLDVENPAGTANPRSLAYVLFTSGSTGQPKAVGVEHRNIVNYVAAVQERLALSAVTDFALLTSLAADLGNTMLFPALCGGGCLHVLTHEQASDASALAAYLRAHPVDGMKAVPSHLAALMSGSHARDLLPRKRLVLGGEPCPGELAHRVRQLAPGCRLFNHYGPTETTVGVLTYETNDADDPHAPLPLGTPLPNTEVFLLDANLEPALPDAVGEVFISGPCVARGYLNRPDLTAERFIPHPFSSQRGERLYRTGDLARRCDRGLYEFVGRADRQIKVRGFRVEPGEIESALRQHPEITDAAVVVKPAEGDAKLIAYVVPQSRSVKSGELRSFLQERLPDYMVPSQFIEAATLPRLASGKIDHRTLAERPLADAAGAAYFAPRDGLEAALADVWRTILRLERVGLHDNFFDLGGHSLLMIQVHNGIRETIGRECSIVDLFKYPTVESLARFLDGQAGVGPAPAAQERAAIRRDATAARARSRESRIAQSR